MSDVLVVDILYSIDELVEEELACFFSHGTHFDAEIEQLMLEVFHNDIRDIVLNVMVCLYNNTGLACLDHADNSVMVQILKNFHFFLEINEAITDFVQVLFLHQLNRHLFLSADLLAEVDLGSHTFTKLPKNLIFPVEDGVRERPLHLRQLHPWQFRNLLLLHLVSRVV